MGMLERSDDPGEIGVDGSRLAHADRLFEEWTERGDPPMPGAAMLVGRGDRYLAPRFFGRQGPEPGAPPLREDGIFLLASITKPVVYLTALQLVEEGRLSLNDPVIRYVPEFAANHKNAVRVEHLMTHTSGLPDMLPDNEELRQAQAPLERFTRGALEVAPLFPAGTNFSYQSMGTLVTSEIVRRLTDQSIRDRLRQRIFEPLGMDSSALGSQGLPPERLVRVETTRGPQAAEWDWNSTYWQRLGVPWGGMFSTPLDMARLCHALLAGREAPFCPLSPRTIEAMTRNQLERMPDLPGPVRRSVRWGLGWKLNSPEGAEGPFSDLLGPQVFGHTGATGTMIWMDPASGTFCILLTTGVRAKSPWRLVQISNIVAAAITDR